MDYIKIFKNAQALSVSVEYYYLEDQLMHTFLDNFHQGGKYSAQIASHQVELRREETFISQKSLSISSLQTDYLNLYSSSGYGRNSERANTIHTKSTFCGGANHSADFFSKGSERNRKKARAADELDNKRKERTPQKCFRCGFEDRLIAKCPKPPKES